MSRIDFYHLQTQSLENVLPVLASRAFQTGEKVKILVGKEENVENINSLLWTYSPSSFLPHGTKKDGFANMQPIYISSSDDNPNEATILILVDGANIQSEDLKTYSRTLNIFDGNSPDLLNEARKFWKDIRELDIELNYWQQDSNGKWEKKG